MYVTVAGIEALMEWFNAPENRYEFLCLLVSRDYKSKQLFSDLLNNWYSVDAATQEAIAVFLFADRDMGMVAKPLQRGMFGAIPGLVIPEGAAYRGLHVLERDLFVPLSQTEREVFAAKSQSMSSEIFEYFELKQDVLPAILIVGRDDPEPLVLPTHGVAEISDVIDLLERLKPLAQLLSEVGSSAPVVEANAHAIEHEIQRVQNEIQALDTEIAPLRRNAVTTLVRHGAKQESAEQAMDPAYAVNVFDALGQNPRKRAVNPEIAEPAVVAMRVNEFKAEVRALQRASRRLASKEKELSRLHVQATTILAEAVGLERRLNHETTLAEEVYGVVENVEHRLKRRATLEFLNRTLDRVAAFADRLTKIASLVRPMAQGGT